MPKSKAAIKFAWHVHHDLLVEPLIEPLKNRIAYIKDNKPEDEIATRLRLLKPVVGGLPTAVAEAGKAYREARKAFDEVVKIHETEILVLHARECPNCPWDNVQQTIFPEEAEKK